MNAADGALERRMLLALVLADASLRGSFQRDVLLDKLAALLDSYIVFVLGAVLALIDDYGIHLVDFNRILDWRLRVDRRGLGILQD